MKKNSLLSTPSIRSPKYQEFGYSWRDRLQRFPFLFAILGTILFTCVLLILLFGLAADVFALLFHTERAASIRLDEIILGPLLGILIIYLLIWELHLTLNQYPGVRINPQGLQIQVFDRFHYKWKFLPWEKVEVIFPLTKFGWLTITDRRRIPFYVVEVGGYLSSWHRQLSKMYGSGRFHAFIIYRDAPRSEALVLSIQNHLNRHKKEMGNKSPSG